MAAEAAGAGLAAAGAAEVVAAAGAAVVVVSFMVSLRLEGFENLPVDKAFSIGLKRPTRFCGLSQLTSNTICFTSANVGNFVHEKNR